MEKLAPDKDPQVNTGPKETSLPEKFQPEIGNKVTVQRSSGEIESGWTIASLDLENKNISVNKEDNNGVILTKKALISDVERFNRQVKLEDISTAKNFPQLEYALVQLKIITGTNQNYTSEDLIKRINVVIKNESLINIITRTAGLRDAVTRLLDQSKQK